MLGRIGKYISSSSVRYIIQWGTSFYSFGTDLWGCLIRCTMSACLGSLLPRKHLGKRSHGGWCHTRLDVTDSSMAGDIAWFLRHCGVHICWYTSIILRLFLYRLTNRFWSSSTFRIFHQFLDLFYSSVLGNDSFGGLTEKHYLLFQLCSKLLCL